MALFFWTLHLLKNEGKGIFDPNWQRIWTEGDIGDRLLTVLLPSTRATIKLLSSGLALLTRL